MKTKALLFTLLILTNLTYANDPDSLIIRKIFDNALTDRTAYENLKYLTKSIGGRLSGSPQAAAAVEFTAQALKNAGADTVYLQPVKVPHWVRGKEKAKIISDVFGCINLRISTIGMSIGTPETGITAHVLEIKSREELEKYSDKIKGKIVFYNQPMRNTNINTYKSYGESVWQRSQGASLAAKYGAVGVIVRSLTTSIDSFPHTGSMRYDDKYAKIPAVMLTTQQSEMLSKMLVKDKKLKIHIVTNCYTAEPVLSYNVVAEIKGSVYPDQIITVGGHLDSWDTGEGAHDDGAGVVQSIELIRLFKTLNIKPKYTIRVVMFMDEEVRQSGGRRFAEIAKEKNEKIIFALESDEGGTTPHGFSFTDKNILEKISNYKYLFEPYGIEDFVLGYGGVDISFLRKLNVPQAGLKTDPQRYFDWHHSNNDIFEHVNIRELQLGSAAIASLIYLIDKYDIK